jgi:hypothetical protein
MRPLLAVLLLAALAIPAAAQAPAPTYELSFAPAKANRATTGTLSVRDLPADPPGTAAPDVLVLAMQPGFTTDPKGAPGRCADADAQKVACPEPSRIGKGTAVIEATFGTTVQEYTAALEVFLTENVRQPGDLAGLALEIKEPQTGTNMTVPGRVVKTGRNGGPEIRFEGLAKSIPPVPPGITVRIKSFSTAIGRHRTVTKKVKRKHSKKKRVVKTTYAIVRTPKECDAAWTATLAIIRTDGSEMTQPLSASCTP